MRTRKVNILTVLVLMMSPGAASTVLAGGGEYEIVRYTVDSGGATFSAGGDSELGATTGQPDAGTQSGGEYVLNGGFWSGGFVDCNGNGIPDGTDIADETSGDCNTNGVPDECDIDAGTSLDDNDNGIPDECEDSCPADFDGSGDISAADLAQLLGSWGPCPPDPGCSADLNDDGSVSAFDLALLLGAWGACG